MAQARAPLARLLFNKETTFRTQPSAAAKVMPFTSYDVKRAANRQANDGINQSPLANKSDQGDASVGGPFSSILDLRTVGNWLLLLLGAPTTGKAVTVQPVNCTGVTVHYASSDCASGAGTLAYTHSGTTLSWAEQGGAAGTPVNVGGGGNFTLQSDGGGASVRVTVVAGSLPGTDASDTGIVVHADLKAHAFPVNTTARPSALLELQHSDLSKYYRVLGAKLNTLGWDVLNNEQNISGNLIAAVETEESAAFDANPTIVAYERACSAKGRIGDHSTGLGTVVGGNVEINNNMTPYMCGDALEGPGLIDEGELMIGGSIRTVWDAAGAYALARAGTSTRIRLESGKRVGSDDWKLVIDALDAELSENAPPKQGRSGLFTDLAWRLHRGTYAPEIYLVNDVASY